MFGYYYAAGPSPDHDPADLERAPRSAPHETAGVLRMQRLGMSAAQICRMFKISQQQLIHELTIALDDETEAHRLGNPIHDSGLPEDPVKRSTYLWMYG